jgi:hypothetical protein
MLYVGCLVISTVKEYVSFVLPYVKLAIICSVIKVYKMLGKCNGQCSSETPWEGVR